MLVYGDPAFHAPLGELTMGLAERLQAESRGAASPGQGLLGRLLIFAGQIEQAVEDAGVDAAHLRRATDVVAEAFVGVQKASTFPELAADLVEAARSTGNVTVRVAVPEGFAFYALYPEQYCLAATKWVGERGESRAGKRAIVIGLRSIGTSLSAVVQAVLRGAGWQCTRFTVRPSGHPFDRQVGLPDSVKFDGADVLIVDEGPGMSGSSMAATARSLVAAGADRASISFFPGHGRGPGTAASEETLAWWRTTPTFLATLNDLRFGGRSLVDAVAEQTREFIHDEVTRVDDLGAGAWRSRAFSRETEWPASHAPFERAKYRVETTGGGAVLWKFSGLTTTAGGDMAEIAFRRQATLAAGGWAAAPLGIWRGFVATPWLSGRRLARGTVDTGSLRQVGGYVHACSCDVLSADEHRAGFERLAGMLECNTRESLGETAARRALRVVETARPLLGPSHIAAYGDGRLDPHEWVATADGRLLKTDCAGHDVDHTLVGRQSVLWDLAGALTEWTEDPGAEKVIVDAFRSAGGLELSNPMLQFHQLAYAAFRLGLANMCAASAPDDAERERLRAEEERYRQVLLTHLA